MPDGVMSDSIAPDSGEFSSIMTASVTQHQKVKVRWNIRRTTKKPVTCCMQLCCVWLALIALLVVLMIVVAPISFSLGVPFYDRSEINQQREDAYAAMERDAGFVSTFGQTSGVECVHEDPTWLTRNGTLVQGPAPGISCQRASSQVLRLVYVSSDGVSNILTEDSLREIEKVEQRILNAIELTRYCHLMNSTYPVFETRDVNDWIETINVTNENQPTHTACVRINSVLNFLDELYFDRQHESGLGYHLLPNDQVPQVYNYSSIADVISYWSDFTARSYSLSDYPFAVSTIGDTLTVFNPFWRVTSSDFKVGSSEAVGVTSTYPLGLPLHGYSSSSEKAEDQYSDAGAWLWEEFDAYLKGVDIDGVDLFWADSQGGMTDAESGALALASMSLFPFSILIVLIYLSIMQDSIFIGVMGVLQIFLSFVPSILLYRYVVGEDYFGVLNLIAIYIILGIGVDNIFVFCDQFHHQHEEKDFGRRMQKTYSTAGKAMFTTSCTTFVSFLSSAASVFPAVSTFGLFAAFLVLMNYLAVITFFPAVYAVYYVKVRKIWWDHPSLIICCRSQVPGINNQEDADDESDDERHEEYTEGTSMLVRYFRDVWAPLMLKLRYPIVFLFLGVFAAALYTTMQLRPDENAPSTLPDGNNYKEYPSVLLEHFQRAGNPRAIEVLWVSGINPDEPINRTGTDVTNTTDYGVTDFLDCSTYNPTTASAQVWALQTCHDMFFGNVTEYHGGDSSFASGGHNGPEGRLLVTDNVAMDDFSYYSVVACPMQGFRDWMMTDMGCEALATLGLPCFSETSQREGCTNWDVNGNSCEPFPAPEENFAALIVAFLDDESTDPTTQETNFDKYKDQIFVDDDFDVDENKIVQKDFSCRAGLEGTDSERFVLYAISTVATLDQDFAQQFKDGIELHDKWDVWSKQMREFSPREMIGTMQVSTGAWSFYFLNATLIYETFVSIGLALALSFAILTFIGGNIIMAAFAVLTIILIVTNVMAFTVIYGWSLGVVEAVNYVVVIGMSIDYAVHMSEAYNSSKATTREQRVTDMVEEMGVSVLSGALSTLLAISPMFFAPNEFFTKFGTFLAVTIALSCVYAMTFYPALLGVVGPLGDTGKVYVFVGKCFRRVVYGKPTQKHKSIRQKSSKKRKSAKKSKSKKRFEEQSSSFIESSGFTA